MFTHRQWWGLSSVVLALGGAVFLLFYFSSTSPLEWYYLPSSTSLCKWTSAWGLQPPSPSPPPPLLPVIPQYHTNQPFGVCVVVRTYTQNYQYIPTLMHLLHHNSHVPSVYFVPTDATSSLTDLHHLVDRSNRECGLRFGHVLNVSYEEAVKDFPELEKGEREYGFAYTDVAVDRLVKGEGYEGKCQWLLVSNADNIYSSFFLDRVEQEIEKGYQMIGWNFISHYDRGFPRDSREGSSDDGTRLLLNAEWMEGWADLGSVLWNASLWKEHSLNFIALQRAKKPQWEIADGTFFKHLYNELNVKRIIIRQVLFLHQ